MAPWNDRARRIAFLLACAVAVVAMTAPVAIALFLPEHIRFSVAYYAMLIIVTAVITAAVKPSQIHKALKSDAFRMMRTEWTIALDLYLALLLMIAYVWHGIICEGLR